MKIIALGKLKDSFAAPALALGLSAAALGPVGTAHAQNAQEQTAANAQNGNEICRPLIKGWHTDEPFSADTSAGIHSEKYPGTVGIAAYPGPDLYKTPAQLIYALKKHYDVDAVCYINDSMFEGGTQYTFWVAGGPVEYRGEDSFGIKKLRDNPDILGQVHYNALMATINADKLRERIDPRLRALNLEQN